MSRDTSIGFPGMGSCHIKRRDPALVGLVLEETVRVMMTLGVNECWYMCRVWFSVSRCEWVKTKSRA